MIGCEGQTSASEINIAQTLWVGPILIQTEYDHTKWSGISRKEPARANP